MKVWYIEELDTGLYFNSADGGEWAEEPELFDTHTAAIAESYYAVRRSPSATALRSREVEAGELE